ncbi:MAG: hypothetical protein VX335_00915 [Pseudomonadota bacterium]|nr:hypothetical protein [Pseudomonadota bacterium]
MGKNKNVGTLGELVRKIYPITLLPLAIFSLTILSNSFYPVETIAFTLASTLTLGIVARLDIKTGIKPKSILSIVKLIQTEIEETKCIIISSSSVILSRLKFKEENEITKAHKEKLEHIRLSKENIPKILPHACIIILALTVYYSSILYFRGCESLIELTGKNYFLTHILLLSTTIGPCILAIKISRYGEISNIQISQDPNPSSHIESGIKDLTINNKSVFLKKLETNFPLSSPNDEDKDWFFDDI